MYELIVHCIPAEVVLKVIKTLLSAEVTCSYNAFVFKKLSMALLERVPLDFKGAVIEMAAFYDHRLAIGSKAIFHLEVCPISTWIAVASGLQLFFCRRSWPSSWRLSRSSLSMATSSHWPTNP